MGQPKLNLLVIRSVATTQTVSFYSILGFVFVQEQHGKGPVHWAANLGSLVFEIYPATPNESANLIRLGFAIDEIAKTVDALRFAGYEILNDPVDSEWD